METRDFRKHALAPKPRERKRFIPALPDWKLGFLIEKLAPEERKCLARIVETADVVHTKAGDYLIVPAPAELIDTLAAFGAEAEDRENDLDDERDEGMEDDKDSDNAVEVYGGGWLTQIQGEDEPECPAETGARMKIAEARRVPIPENAGPFPCLRRDFAKERREGEKVERFIRKRTRRT